ncbi:hypothetical protein FZ934_12350 [Rhizobium grahamii]|uniref:Uncharacterized protein n=1 Tax=Rhizobium grahamii TaxID=1120045 RepID=A0A5Q0CB73_9HYPH|nr:MULTISPECIES: hypothetical protein [Rhizobium]QFY61131.1 hypothetical protein FZ934_12350 [Rhizobium grahamii]QRM49715.1 hypothetical protein F3Y33_10540 [Rhizobium sp. BG6]
MTDSHSKSRQRAEIAFSSVQTQFFARSGAVEEHESVARARDAKTVRLREARLAKELADSLSTASARIVKR